MSGLELKEPQQIVADEDYEGLLSSYFEPNSWNEARFHRHFGSMTKTLEPDDDAETSQCYGEHRI